MIRAGRLPAWLLFAGVVATGLGQHAWTHRAGIATAWPFDVLWSVPAAGSATASAATAATADGHEVAAPGTVLRTRTLRFVPLADGREAVLDGGSGGLVRMLGADKSEQSFLRTTVRVLQETRALRHAATSAPFTLSLQDPDGLVLTDPLTGARLAVRAFGIAAVAALSPLLTAPAAAPAALPPACPRLEC